MNIDLFNACGCQGAFSSSNKRSPSDLNTTPSLNQLKKPFLGSQENTTTTTTANYPNSFHRCFSDPCSEPVANQLALQSPLDSSKMVGTTAVSLPSQPALRRSVLDPSPNESCSRSSSFKVCLFIVNPNRIVIFDNYKDSWDYWFWFLDFKIVLF